MSLGRDEQRVQFDLINTNLGASQAMVHTIRREQQDHFNQLNSQLISQTQMIMYTMDLFQRGGLLFPSSGVRPDPNATGFVMATSHDQQTDSGNTRSTSPPISVRYTQMLMKHQLTCIRAQIPRTRPPLQMGFSLIWEPCLTHIIPGNDGQQISQQSTGNARVVAEKRKRIFFSGQSP